MEKINVIYSEQEPLVVQSNKIIESKYSLTLGEQRLLLAMISLIRSDDEDFKPYVIRVADLASFLKVSQKSAYREADVITSRLMKRVLHIPLENGGVLKTHWVSDAKHEEGQITLSFSPNLKPYLIKLKEQFTQYRLRVATRFKSVYSVRMYGLLKQYEGIGKREFELEKLKEILDVQDKYLEFKRFRSGVLDRAKKEFDEKSEDGTFKSDIAFEFEPVRRGRKTVGVIFSIQSRKKENSPKPELLEVSPLVENPLVETLIYYGISQQMAESILEEEGEQVVSDCIKIYEKQLEKGTVKDTSGAYLATLLQQGVKKGCFESEQEEKAHKKQEAKEKQQHKRERIKDLQKEFKMFLEAQIKIITSQLSPKKKEQLQKDFEKRGLHSQFERQYYQKHGLNSALTKACYKTFLKEELLSEEDRDFLLWANEQGHSIEKVEGAEDEYRFSE